jgi:hypothetical protein
MVAGCKRFEKCSQLLAFVVFYFMCGRDEGRASYCLKRGGRKMRQSSLYTKGGDIFVKKNLKTE